MRRGSDPSCRATTRPYSPPASLNHAMREPSGDHTGWRSATPGLRVRLRHEPSFAGTLKSSPRHSKRARRPVGDRPAPRSRSGRHLFPARPRPVHVAGRADLQLPGAARRRIELVQIARLLVDHDAGTRPQRLDVEVRVPRELALFSAAGVERPDVAGPVALGQVVDDAVHPRRVQLALARPRRRHALPGRRGHDGDRLRLTAAVVPPLRIPVADLLVRHVRAVPGHLPQVGLRERERARQPARGRHRIELPLHGRHALPARPEEHVSLRGPALDRVLGRVPGQPLGLAAGGGHDVDVGVPPVLAREGDPPPVGAERRIGLGAVRAGEPRGVAAAAPHDPQVVGVHEDDVRSAHVGLPQEARPLGVGDGRRREGRDGQERREHGRPAGGNRVVAEHGSLPSDVSASRRRRRNVGARGQSQANFTANTAAMTKTPAGHSRHRPASTLLTT